MANHEKEEAADRRVLRDSEGDGEGCRRKGLSIWAGQFNVRMGVLKLGQEKYSSFIFHSPLPES